MPLPAHLLKQNCKPGMPEVFGVTGPLTYWPLASPFFSPGPFLPYFWASHLPHPTP